MTPESWKKIGNIIEQALTLEGANREEFLKDIYSKAPDLKEEIEALLDAYESDKDFLEAPAVPGLSIDQNIVSLRQVGPYRIIRPLGRGGMGEVFLAQREEGQVAPFVALKLIKASHDDVDVLLVRFQVEQQILSELTHPNIARLLDAGTAEDGRPYFVMEYVDGVSITEYCDRNQLSVDERLRLFLKACEAVQFAHRNLIVHRDLKPGNLLVTESGDVKLLDFGIAKALGPWQDGVSAYQTRTGFRLMTPLYASPEQIKGHAISTASDVYSLGVLLYELLTGRRPLQLANKLEVEVVRVITEEEPTRPSDVITQHLEVKEEDGTTTVVSPARVGAYRQTSVDRLQRKLKGELDNMVLMALRKEPARRYTSASGFGDDIRRYLEGLPVEAQPDTLSYRVGKFVGRHPLGVAAAAVIAILLMVFSAITFIQSKRIQAQSVLLSQERDVARAAAGRAEEEAEKAEEIVDILVGLFESANPLNVSGADTLRVNDFLIHGEDEVLEDLNDRPEIQVRVKQVLGQMYWAQGNWDKGAELLESGLEQQRTLKQDNEMYEAELLRDFAMMVHEMGRRDTALVMLENALAQMRAAPELDKDELASTLLSFAPMLPYGDHERKANMLEEANTIIEGLEEPDDMQRASVANQLGVFYYNQGLYSKALSPFRKTLQYLESAVGRSHPYYLITAGNLAGVYTSLNLLEESKSLHLHVLEERRKKDNPYHETGIAWTLSALGQVALLQADWALAESYMEEAYRIILQAKGKDHHDTADFALGFATALMGVEQYERATGLIMESSNLMKQHYGEVSVEYAWAVYKQALLHKRKGEWDDAIKKVDEAIQIWLSFYPDGQYTSIAAARLTRGLIYLEQNLLEAANEDIQFALAYRKEHESTSVTFLAEAQIWAGVVLSRLGQHEESLPLLEEAWFIKEDQAFITDKNREDILLARREAEKRISP